MFNNQKLLIVNHFLCSCDFTNVTRCFNHNAARAYGISELTFSSSHTLVCCMSNKLRMLFCHVGDAVVLSIPPERVCRFNPCEKSTCYTYQAERCVVSYGCKPIFFGVNGQRLNCRGKVCYHQASTSLDGLHEAIHGSVFGLKVCI